jgi:uncharacterized protein
MIFVDSSAWFAVFSLRDANHPVAMSIIRSIHEPLITSDYIVDETLTLLRARGENHRALVFGKRVVEGGWAKIVKIDDTDFAAAWTIFRNYHDKEWSFTDCTSLVVIKQLGIAQAFAFDEHFRQFGIMSVVP